MTDASPAAVRSARPLGLAVGGVLALAAAMGVGRFVYTPILPLMVEALGLSQGQAGAIASANFAGYLAGALLAAAPTLPGSRRGWFVGALAASAATTALMAAVESVALFALLRFLGGVASAVVLVQTTTLVFGRLAGQGRPGLAPAVFSGVGVGVAGSSLSMLALGLWGGGWRAAWLLAGALTLLAVLVAVRLVPPEPGEKDGRRSAKAGGGAWRGFALLAASYGLFGFGYVITATFIVALVRQDAGTRPLEPYVWLLVGLSAIPSVWLWTQLGRLIGLYRAYALCFVVEAVGVAASVLSQSVAGVIVASVFLGGTFMGLTALGLAAAREAAPADPRRALALMTAAFGLGQIIGPSFAGLVHDVTGNFVAPSLAAAGALLLGAGLAFVVGVRAARAMTG